MHRLFVPSRAGILALVLVACAAKQGPAAAPAPVAPPSEPSALPPPLLDMPATSSVERLYTLASSEGPKLGPDSAKAKLEVCSDFECPYCAQLVPTVHELVENYGELVQIRWRHCPLPFHKRALPASEAAAEVYKQGGDAAFWAYHDQLFAHQQALEDTALAEYAGAIQGIDVAQVRAALADHRHAPAVKADMKAVIDSGAASQGFGTPATFINGRVISGAQPYEEFENAVERALKETPEERKQAQAESDAAYPMVHLRHILIQYVGARGAPESIKRSKDEARAIASQLHQRVVLEHAPLAELAKTSSDCPSAPEGGDLGRFSRGELVPELENVVFALKPGEVSPVVDSPFGFHIILREP